MDNILCVGSLGVQDCGMGLVVSVDTSTQLSLIDPLQHFHVAYDEVAPTWRCITALAEQTSTALLFDARLPRTSITSIGSVKRTGESGDFDVPRVSWSCGM